MVTVPSASCVRDVSQAGRTTNVQGHEQRVLRWTQAAKNLLERGHKWGAGAKAAGRPVSDRGGGAAVGRYEAVSQSDDRLGRGLGRQHARWRGRSKPEVAGDLGEPFCELRVGRTG